MQRKGGSNHIELFAISGGAFDTSEKVMNQIYSCDFARRTDLGFDVTIDQDEDSPGLESFFEDYRVAESSGGGSGKKYEDGGDPATGGGSTDKILGAIIYSGKSDTDVKIVFACFKLDPTSGSWKTEDGVESHPTFKLISVPAPTAITIAATKFAAAKVTQPGSAKTLAAGSMGKVDYLPKAA